MMQATVEELLHSWSFIRRKRRPKAWDDPISSYVGLYGRRENRKVSDKIENDFVNLRNNLFLSLVSFWCAR